MALLERVSTLLRANISDLLARSEDPEKLARQLVLDMENQLLQVKTQVAIAIADQHLLKRKLAEQQEQQAEWRRKAEAALARGQEELARPALERSLSYQRLGAGLEQQLADQTVEVDTLRSAYSRLQQRLQETQARVDLLATQQRRTRAIGKATAAQTLLQNLNAQAKLAKLSLAIDSSDARNTAERTLLAVAAGDTLNEHFDAIEQRDQIEALLLELKERQALNPDRSSAKEQVG